MKPTPIEKPGRSIWILLAAVGLLSYQFSGIAATKLTPLGNEKDNNNKAGHQVFFAAEGLPSGVEVTVSFSGINNGEKSKNSDATFVPPLLGGAGAMEPNTAFTYAFPPEIKVGSDIYDLVGSQPTSGLVLGLGQGETIITATYALRSCENKAPTITASDYVVEDPCPIWDGTTLTLSVAIPSDESDSPNEHPLQALFNCEIGDPDGDPVTVTADVSEVTLTGFGDQEIAVTLTVRDDPSATCPFSEAKETPVTVYVRARLAFTFIGFDSPLTMEDAGLDINNGQTVPVKFRLTDCIGTEICTEQNKIEVHLASDPSAAIAVADSGKSNEDSEFFRYEGTPGEGGTYIYNLSTKNGYEVGESYVIRAVLQDGTAPEAIINVTK